ERLTGGGLLSMDDVDLVGVPILPGLLEAMQVLPKGRKGVSDLHVLFALDSGVATIEEGRLANPVSALDIEKGGKIDLKNRRLDLHVVVVGIQQLHAVLKAIPLLNLAVDFKDKLTRFHVLGPWEDPPAKLIRKEPLADISKGTEDFFKGVVETGGQIGPGIIKGLKGIGDLFKKLDETLKKPRE
ncbi:MAG: AsmA-like C-terminal domain-containing protein, partial [Phycisphaerae bacterium]